VRQAGVLRVGHAVEAPYADLEADGRVSGESPENARRIAARAGLPHIEWVQVEFDQLIEGLQAGRFDLVAAGLFITPERSRQLLFSEPSLCVRPGWLLREDAPPGLDGSYAEALQQPGLRIAVLRGSAEAAVLAGYAGLREVPDARAGRLAVLRGAADALALSLPTVRALARQGRAGRCRRAPPCPPAPGLWSAPARSVPGASRVGFAFAPQDRALQALEPGPGRLPGQPRTPAGADAFRAGRR
jgi:polar amino acid transport system substrate-binding protein